MVHFLSFYVIMNSFTKSVRNSVQAFSKNSIPFSNYSWCSFKINKQYWNIYSMFFVNKSKIRNQGNTKPLTAKRVYSIWKGERKDNITFSRPKPKTENWQAAHRLCPRIDCCGSGCYGIQPLHTVLVNRQIYWMKWVH